MRVQDIEPRFDDIEGRLTALEADQHTHSERQPDQIISTPQTSQRRATETGEAESPNGATFPSAQKADAHAGLKADIQADMKVYDAGVVGQALLHKVCIRDGNRDFCRSEEMEIETGDIKRVQPFKLTDAKYTVLTRDMLNRVLSETEVDKIEWQAEAYDCEDIARKFATRCCDLGINSVGRVLSASGEHAFNIAIIQDGASVDVVFIEPQTDQFVEPVSFKPGTEEHNNYNMYNASMIIS
ncbi:MAG: hypothetical protein OXU51_07860 [Candidatus Poribacteria bacterium]|nr:hypothetical protein [Candidatus Poribacteria bacterium]